MSTCCIERWPFLRAIFRFGRGDERLTRRKATNGPNVIVFLETHPVASLVAFCAIHFLIWTALPASVFSNPFMDVIEGLNYGREWQAGHDKHPPLPWWIIELIQQEFGHPSYFYAISQVAVLVGLVFVWLLARELVGILGAWSSLLITDGLHYFHFSAVKFNHDVLQVPFWAIAGWAYYNALRRGHVLHWTILGASVGAAFWTKYFVVALVGPLVLFAVFNSEARRAFWTPGPYIAAATALFVMSPHIVWLIKNDFPPLAYINARFVDYRSSMDHFVYPIKFAAWQLWYLLPGMLIASPVLLTRPVHQTSTRNPFDLQVVMLLAIGPAAVVILGSAITGRGLQVSWGYPLWIFVGLGAVVACRQTVLAPEFLRLSRIWFFVFLSAIIVFLARFVFIPFYNPDFKPTHQGSFPGRELAHQIVDRYIASTGELPRYVIGSMWIGGNVSYFAPGRPKLFIESSVNRAPWIDPEDIVKNGGVVVWTEADSDDSLRGDVHTVPQSIRSLTTEAEIGEPFDLRYRRGSASVRVGWAIIRPSQPRDESSSATRKSH